MAAAGGLGLGFPGEKTGERGEREEEHGARVHLTTRGAMAVRERQGSDTATAWHGRHSEEEEEGADRGTPPVRCLNFSLSFSVSLKPVAL